MEREREGKGESESDGEERGTTTGRRLVQRREQRMKREGDWMDEVGEAAEGGGKSER